MPLCCLLCVILVKEYIFLKSLVCEYGTHTKWFTMSHHSIPAYIVQHRKPKWCRCISVRQEIWRSPVQSRRWASVLRLRNNCPKPLPGAFKWPMSLTGQLTNVNQSLLKQGWNRCMLVKKHNIFFLVYLLFNCMSFHPYTEEASMHAFIWKLFMKFSRMKNTIFQEE